MSAPAAARPSRLLRNPVLWGAVGVVVLALVGLVALGGAVHYDGPADTTCGIEYSGSQSWAHCSDAAASEAATAALFGVVEPSTTISSEPLLWLARVALLPAAALLVWTLGGLVVAAFIGLPGSPRRELRAARRRQAARRRAG